jgi:hypothetical protein
MEGCRSTVAIDVAKKKYRGRKRLISNAFGGEPLRRSFSAKN